MKNGHVVMIREKEATYKEWAKIKTILKRQILERDVWLEKCDSNHKRRKISISIHVLMYVKLMKIKIIMSLRGELIK